MLKLPPPPLQLYLGIFNHVTEQRRVWIIHRTAAPRRRWRGSWEEFKWFQRNSLRPGLIKSPGFCEVPTWRHVIQPDSHVHDVLKYYKSKSWCIRKRCHHTTPHANRRACFANKKNPIRERWILPCVCPTWWKMDWSVEVLSVWIEWILSSRL